MINDKQNICHFLMTPFTGLGLFQGYRGDDWLRNRIEIFKNYTLKAILNQTNENFIHCLNFRPQEKINPQVMELERHLKKIRHYQFIFTYHGIMFWDDKYENDNLKERLEQTLPELKEIIGKRKYVYETVQPSDDMYLCDAVEKIQLEDYKDKKAICYVAGYILNAQTGQLAEYNPLTNPPFYTLMYTTEQFLNPEWHFNWIRKIKSHELVGNYTNYFPYNERKFCVAVHGENISTNWSFYKGREIEGKEKVEVCGKLGIDPFIKEFESLKQKSSALAVKRKIIQRIPFNNILRKLYYVFHE